MEARSFLAGKGKIVLFLIVGVVALFVIRSCVGGISLPSPSLTTDSFEDQTSTTQNPEIPGGQGIFDKFTSLGEGISQSEGQSSLTQPNNVETGGVVQPEVPKQSCGGGKVIKVKRGDTYYSLNKRFQGCGLVDTKTCLPPPNLNLINVGQTLVCP